MIYLKINGSDTQYDAYVEPFVTQHGNAGVRIIGEVPQTNQGFKVYDDDTVISDFSAYVYPYGEDAYTSVSEEIEDGECTFEPLPVDDSFRKLVRRVNKINAHVDEITPYTATKVAYAKQKVKVFYNVPEGNTSIFFDNYSGEYQVKRVANRLKITFPALTDKTNITVMVQ